MDFCSIPLAGKLCSAADAIDFVSDPGKAITEGIGNWIAKSTGQLAAAAADLAAEAVNRTTQVDLGAGWFRSNYELILPIGLVLLVATFCAQLIRAAVKRDGQTLGQAFTGTMSGVLFAFSAIAATTVAIEVVDALSDGLFKAAESSLSDAVRRMVKVSQLGALGPLGWLVCAFCGIGAAIGAFLYWCVMMVRKVGILVMVTLAVFAGAGGGWEVARRWRRGWIEATATLVCSKLLMTVIFLLGISAMGKADSKGGLDALADVMSGIVIMILVLLCPYATFKFVHWASEGTNGEDIHRAGGAGAQLAKQHTERAARKAAQAAATAGTGGAAAGAGAAGAAAPQGPDAIPGGFPGDIAPTSSGGQGGGSGSSGDGVMSGLEKAVQPPPTRPSDDTSGQFGGGPGQGGGGHGGPGSAADTGQGGGWMSAPPTNAAPPPQGAPPAPNAGTTTNGPTAPTPPPTGI
ncbi:ATP-binding protein [Streptomyces mobaraensis]|uniref:SCO6881 family protein n=1 Tax=Streptomyces mobaraensis TaxID=35621 RepID=UPI0033344CE7